MLNFVCALACEALPIIQYFQMKQVESSRAFTLHASETTRLITSGVGKVNVAAATTYLFAHADEPRDALFCQVGIAGHPTLRKGEAAIVTKITDHATNRSYFPTFLDPLTLPGHPLITVDQPERPLPKPALYDREGSAFFATASRFTSSEFVQLIKVVSDNGVDPLSTISKQEVSAMITQNLEAILEFLEGPLQRSQQLAKLRQNPEEVMNAITHHCHFTKTEKLRLKMLLQRMGAVEPLEKIWSIIDSSPFKKCQRSGEVLQLLENRLMLPLPLIPTC